MAKSKETYGKKEKEKLRRKKKQEKLERKKQRKLEKAERGKNRGDGLTYVDEFGNFTDTPPDPKKRTEVKLEDIVIGVPDRDEEPEDGIRKGQVKFFNEEKGFGFIIDAITGDSIFVHANNLSEPIRERDRVSFEVEMGAKGPVAVNVNLEK